MFQWGKLNLCLLVGVSSLYTAKKTKSPAACKRCALIYGKRRFWGSSQLYHHPMSVCSLKCTCDVRMHTDVCQIGTASLFRALATWIYAMEIKQKWRRMVLHRSGRGRNLGDPADLAPTTNLLAKDFWKEEPVSLGPVADPKVGVLQACYPLLIWRLH